MHTCEGKGKRTMLLNLCYRIVAILINIKELINETSINMQIQIINTLNSCLPPRCPRQNISLGNDSSRM